MVKTEKLNGVQKAAILFITLGPEAAAGIIKRLPEKEIQKITYEISNISYVGPEDKEVVIDEFIEMASARQYVLDGGIDYAKNLLNKVKKVLFFTK